MKEAKDFEKLNRGWFGIDLNRGLNHTSEVQRLAEAAYEVGDELATQ